MKIIYTSCLQLHYNPIKRSGQPILLKVHFELMVFSAVHNQQYDLCTICTAFIYRQLYINLFLQPLSAIQDGYSFFYSPLDFSTCMW